MALITSGSLFPRAAGPGRRSLGRGQDSWREDQRSGGECRLQSMQQIWTALHHDGPNHLGFSGTIRRWRLRRQPRPTLPGCVLHSLMHPLCIPFASFACFLVHPLCILCILVLVAPYAFRASPALSCPAPCQPCALPPAGPPPVRVLLLPAHRISSVLPLPIALPSCLPSHRLP